MRGKMFSSTSSAARILFTVMLAGLLGLSAVQAAAQVCEKLSSLNLDDTTITSAQTVASGEFTRPAGPFDQHEDTLEAFKRLPAFCRVTAEIKPSSDSDIKVEVWMPVSGWNGKYQAVGNGGWAGSLNTKAMIAAVQRGYATSSTDTGHTGGNAIFALGHPEKLIDYAYRSEHEMTVTAKKMIAAFYGRG